MIFRINLIFWTALLIAFGNSIPNRVAAQTSLTAREARGKQIYLRGASPSGKEILAYVGESSLEAPASSFPCANCHGADGLGKPEGGITPSDISWDAAARGCVAAGVAVRAGGTGAAAAAGCAAETGAGVVGTDGAAAGATGAAAAKTGRRAIIDGLGSRLGAATRGGVAGAAVAGAGEAAAGGVAASFGVSAVGGGEGQKRASSEALARSAGEIEISSLSSTGSLRP